MFHRRCNWSARIQYSVGVPSACFRRLASCGLNGLNHDLSSCPPTRCQCIPSVVPMKVNMASLSSCRWFYPLLIDSLRVEYRISNGFFSKPGKSKQWLQQGGRMLWSFSSTWTNCTLAQWHPKKKGCLESHEICSPNGSTRGKSRPTCSPIQLPSVHVIRVLNGFWHWNF